MTFARQVEELLALTGETLDDELIEATRALRDVAAEADEVDARFEGAMLKVRHLLHDRIQRPRRSA